MYLHVICTTDKKNLYENEATFSEFKFTDDLHDWIMNIRNSCLKKLFQKRTREGLAVDREKFWPTKYIFILKILHEKQVLMNQPLFGIKPWRLQPCSGKNQMNWPDRSFQSEWYFTSTLKFIGNNSSIFK